MGRKIIKWEPILYQTALGGEVKNIECEFGIEHFFLAKETYEREKL